MLDVAMVFGAGLGTRMKELTKNQPKPLVKVLDKPLIEYMLNNLKDSGIKRVVVNSFYEADMLENYLKIYSEKNKDIEIKISREEVRLETGGGIVKALKYLSDEFFTFNSDIILLNGKEKALDRLRSEWNPSEMDMLLLLVPLEKAIGYNGEGDFSLSPEGYLSKIETDGSEQQYVYTGVQIIKSELFKDYSEGEIFSLSQIYKEFLLDNKKSIRGLVHDSQWLHVGDPESVNQAEQHLQKTASAYNHI